MTVVPREPATEKHALLSAFAVFGLFWGSWVVLLPALKIQLGLDDGALGLHLGVIALAALPTMPLAGRLVDRWGTGRLVRWALLAFAVTLPLTAFCGPGALLIAVFAALGLTTGVLDVVINAATAAWEHTERTRLMAGVHGMFSAGTLVGSVATGFARSLGATPARVLPVVALLVVAVAVRQPSYRRPERGHSGERSRLEPVLILLGMLVAASFLVEDALQSWSALQLERGLGAPSWVSGLGPGLFAAAMTSGRFASHLRGAGHRDAVVVSTGGAAVAVGSLLLASAPVPWIALAGLFVAGAGTSVLAPTLFSAVGARTVPSRQGAALGTVTTLGYVGFLVGPPVVGLVSAASSLPVALGLLGVVGLTLSGLGPLVLGIPSRGRSGTMTG